MFSNSRFSLDYNTMSNQEIMNIRIDKLSKKGIKNIKVSYFYGY
jgi:hypothetical protein